LVGTFVTLIASIANLITEITIITFHPTLKQRTKELVKCLRGTTRSNQIISSSVVVNNVQDENPAIAIAIDNNNALTTLTTINGDRLLNHSQMEDHFRILEKAWDN